MARSRSRWVDVSEAGTQQNPIPTNTPHSSDGPKDLTIQPQGTHRRYTGMTPRKSWLYDDEDDAATDYVRHRVLGLPSTRQGIKEAPEVTRSRPTPFFQTTLCAGRDRCPFQESGQHMGTTKRSPTLSLSLFTTKKSKDDRYIQILQMEETKALHCRAQQCALSSRPVQSRARTP
jgi:hypothetical protein